MTEKIKKELEPTHDRLLFLMNQYMEQNYPELEQLYFHVTNECKRYPRETQDSFNRRLGNLNVIGVKSGVLDHILYYKGAMYGFDVKTGKQKFSKRQKTFVESLRLHGGNGWVIRDLEEFKRIINTIIH